MSFGKSLSFFLPILVGGLVSGSFAAVEFKEADITTVKNIVERNEGSGAVPAKVSDKIGENSMVSTAAASMAELTFADSSITRMGSNTQFSFKSKERLVKLEQGTVLIHTPPGNGGATVDAGGVTAAVSGTTFMASRDASGNAMFVLLEGQGGLKVTVGGSSVVIRPGQAASVGADAIQEAKSTASADAGSVAPAPGTAAATEDKKSGGSGQGPASSGGGEGGTPPPAASPKIQVFEVDVKKVVASTPLIVEFKNELPSAAKIEKTIETQQVMVKEGKLESLGVEVVAVKSKDGDPLVGAPRVEKEEMVVVNKKTDLAAGRGGAGGLDIDTAAGPGAGGGPAPDARPLAQAAPTAPAPPPPTAPVINTVSQIASGTATTAQLPPTSLDLAISSGGLVRATLDRATSQAAPVGLSVPSMPGLVLSPSSLNIPSGATTTGDVALSLANPKNFFPGWDSSFNLLPIMVTASAGSFSDSVTTTALWPTKAIQDANPVQNLLAPPQMPAKALAALDAYFYFDQAAPGVTDGPASFFSSVAGSTLNLGSVLPTPVDLRIPWTMGSGATTDETLGEIFELRAAGLVKALGSYIPFALGGKTQVVYGGNVDLGMGSTWMNTTGAYNPNYPSLGNPTSLANSQFPFWDAVEYDPLASSWRAGSWLTWNDESTAPFSSAVHLMVSPGTVAGGSYTPSLVFLAGGDGNQGTADLLIRGVDFNMGSSQLNLISNGSARIEAAWFHNLLPNMGLSTLPWSWEDNNIDGRASFSLEAKDAVILGASSAPAGTVGATTASQNTPVAENDAELKQVRIEATDTSAGGTMPPSTPGSLAVVRSGDSLELRNVVIRGFAGAKLEGAAGRVLVSGTTMRDFKIKELAGLAVNVDAKIQMAVVDSGGDLAGTMQVAGGLPVKKLPTGQIVEVAINQLQRRSTEIQLDANEVSLAADKIHLGADALRTQISAQNLIALRANTVLLQNVFMTAVQLNGMINVYVQDNSSVVYAASSSAVVSGKLNFMGASTFKIANNTFSIVDQTSLQDAINNNYVRPNVSSPVVGAINVMPLF